jgi:hypothetical protein
MASSASRESPSLENVFPQQDLYGNLQFSSSTQIRLLELLPACADFEASSTPWYEHVNIRCNLRIFEIDEAPPYEALSYTWGNDDPSVNITFNGIQVMVVRNLADALAGLRGQSSRLLWNDALCINQGNAAEKSHQIDLMREIYPHAASVLVWLGRPKTRTEFPFQRVMSILERLGEAQPTSRLPPLPPDANVPREAEFDRWIQDLKASYSLDKGKDVRRISNNWGSQLREWERIKEERVWAQMRRKHRPDLIAQMETSKASWISLQEELRTLQDQLTEQNALVAELSTQVHRHEQAMNAPLSRLFKRFLVRQEKAISAADFKVQLPEDPLCLPNESSHVEQLYRRIDGNLGEFQRYIFDRHQTLMGQDHQGFNVQEDLERLDQWRSIEVAERRASNDLKKQYQRWCRLENNQSEALKSTRRGQDQTLQNLILSWDDGREALPRQVQTLRVYEENQCITLKDHITQQINALESMRDEHERQWDRYPASDPGIDEFLNQTDLEHLANLKDSMRELHRQLLTTCITETCAYECDFLSRQQVKLCYNIHDTVNNMPTVEEEEKHMRTSLLQAQSDWVEQWKSQRQQEVAHWQNRVFRSETDTFSLSETFLALEAFCNLPYWSRLWIVQEVLLAKNLVLCFDDDVRTTRDWNLLSQSRRCLDSIPTAWDFDPYIEEQLMTIQGSSPFRLDRMRENSAEEWTLLRLVEITEGARCSHPRDKVYGLLGVAYDCPKGDIVPDTEKPTQEVFLDTIEWYHQKYGRDESHPSIVQFSKSLQLSFNTYDDPMQKKHDTDSRTPPTHINWKELPEFKGAFCVKGIQKGPIMDLKQFLDDSTLFALRQRDWIGVMAEYLDAKGTQNSRVGIENELVHLSSIETNFAMKQQTTAYCTCDVEEAGAIPIEQQTTAKDISDVGEPGVTPSVEAHSNDEQQFFMLDNGQFGVASIRIHEDDILCEFEDQQTALILRRTTNGPFTLVSRAILSQPPQVPQINFDAIESGSNVGDVIMSKHSLQTSVPSNRAKEPTIYVHLDPRTLQQLTESYKISARHKFREASFVHEADFGWYDFMTFGIDTTAEALVMSLFTDDSSTENVPSLVTNDAPQPETPGLRAIDEAQAPTPRITSKPDIKDPLLLKMLKSALPSKSIVSHWTQSNNRTLLLDIGSSI